METEIHHRIHKCQGPRLSVWKFRYKVRFYGKELLAPRSTPKQEVHPLQAVHDCLFNILADDIHIGGRSSIRNLRTRHAVVTGTRLSRANTGYLSDPHQQHANVAKVRILTGVLSVTKSRLFVAFHQLVHTWQAGKWRVCTVSIIRYLHWRCARHVGTVSERPGSNCKRIQEYPSTDIVQTKHPNVDGSNFL